jgi:hypothetical protein
VIGTEAACQPRSPSMRRVGTPRAASAASVRDPGEDGVEDGDVIGGGVLAAQRKAD